MLRLKAFLLGIVLVYSLMVWPAMGQKCTPESYGQNEPATLLSRTPDYWVTMLLKGLREFTEVKKLTPELVNTLIQRIEVHNSDRSGGKITVKVDIYFTAAGMIDLPTEKELEKLIAEYEREHAEKDRSKAAVS